MEQPKHSVQFIRPQPLLTVSFYMEYQKKIMNEFKYENSIQEIFGFYDITTPNAFLRFEDYSFDLSKFYQKSGKMSYMKGLLAHHSTIEAFNKISIYEELMSQANKNSEDPYTFILLIYGDLKNYVFQYSLVEINTEVDLKIKKITNVEKLQSEDKEKIVNLIEMENKKNSKCFSNEVLNFYNSGELKYKEETSYVFVHDISSQQTNIPNFVKSALKVAKMNSVNVVLLKDQILSGNGELKFSKSVVVTIEEIKVSSKLTMFDQSKLKINTADLKQIFNPINIAENAVDLNINLMKWRMAPDIDVNIIREKKFLLIGAGTLGCHVSRNLLGWGARNIDFLDCGRVSYSNPVRQSLYTFSDSSTEEGNFKAIIAAKRLKEIFPLVNSEGFQLQIPLPSRALVNKSAEESYLNNVKDLEGIIAAHDVIFLLTDSRESRWYPTVIAKALNKLVITAAIGFDSFLVMRHGYQAEGFEDENVGCYFCNDIVSPIDTSSNRTLDQQCTISRPGISSICSGFASELAISMLQRDRSYSVGGNVPQSVRGNLTDYNFLCIAQSSFKNCVACSELVQKEYLNDRETFLIKVMNDPYYIEQICGVEKLINEINLDEVEVGDDF